MLMKNKNNFFFNIDILSKPPQLRIFGNYNYKTTWSTIISLIVLIFSFGFTLFSSLKYFHFEKKYINYFKNSIYNKTLSFNLNEILLMLKLGEAFKDDIINYDNMYLKAFLYNFDFNSSYEYKPVEIRLEECELYKNIDKKFADVVREYESSHKKNSLRDFYCINREDSQKYYLYYNQSNGYNYLSIALYYNNISNKDLDISLKSMRIYAVLESDFVDHNNNKNPIESKYIEICSSNFNNEILGTTVFDLNYIEYDSDDGFIFEKLNRYKGIRLNSETQEFYFQKTIDNNFIGRIKIIINKNTFDKYRRNYTKIPELFSEIESIVNLFFIVGRILANIIDRKK